MAKLPTGILTAVLSYRATVVETSTPVDACSLYRAMSTPADFPTAFAKARSFINRHDSHPCDTPNVLPDTVYEGVRVERNRGCVRLGAATLGDSTAKVSLGVVKHGDASFSEDYILSRRRDGTWVATGVTLHGLLFVSYVSNPGC